MLGRRKHRQGLLIDDASDKESETPHEKNDPTRCTRQPLSLDGEDEGEEDQSASVAVTRQSKDEVPVTGRWNTAEASWSSDFVPDTLMDYDLDLDQELGAPSRRARPGGPPKQRFVFQLGKYRTREKPKCDGGPAR